MRWPTAALLLLCIALGGCGSSNGAATESQAPSPLLALERRLEHDYGLRHAECRPHHGRSDGSRFVCYIAPRGAVLRLSVTEEKGRRPVVTDCTVAREKQNQFATCAVTPRSSP
jgi:hypothetical protein